MKLSDAMLVTTIPVVDLERARSLDGRRVEFLDYDDGPLKTTGHVAHMGPARGAWFRDTEGNILGLREG